MGIFRSLNKRILNVRNILQIKKWGGEVLN